MSEYDSKGQIDKSKWVRHAVAVPSLTRTYTRVAKADDWSKDNKAGVHIIVEEMVHIHHVYRQVDAKGNALKSHWFRGARVS